MTYSTQAEKQFQLLSPTELFVFTLRFIHSASEDYLFVIDTKELTAGGKIYAPIAARLNLPQAQEGQAPTASLTVDNVRGLSEVIESTYGLRGGKVEIQQRFTNRPDQVESAILLDIKSLSMTNKSVQIGLGFGSVLDLPMIAASYRRASTKGLF